MSGSRTVKICIVLIYLSSDLSAQTSPLHSMQGLPHADHGSDSKSK